MGEGLPRGFRITAGGGDHHLINRCRATLLGTDSHTPMVNGLGIVGWGVGGIEGARNLSVPDRATIANMAPEYGASLAYFPADEKTSAYYRLTGRDEKAVALSRAYLEQQGLYGIAPRAECDYSREIVLDLRDVEPCIAGPRKPEQRLPLSSVASSFLKIAAAKPVAAVDARTDPSFVIMARTDALAVEGLDAAIAHARACVDAGADMLFPEAVTELATYATFAEAVGVPILANVTEFGRTSLFTREELRSAKVAIALYPMSAFRAMSAAAEAVFAAIRNDGTQRGVLDRMQTRDELYEVLGYHAFKKQLDRLFSAAAAEERASGN